MAYDFIADATPDYIDYGDTTILDGLSTWTVTAMVWLDDTSQDHYITAKIESGFQGTLLYFDQAGPNRNNQYSFFYRDVPSSGNIIRVEGAANSATTGSWQHVTGTIDVGAGGVANLWIDGTKDANSGVSASVAAVFPDHIDPLVIGTDGLGAWGPTQGRSMDGKIAEVAYWNRVLDDSEIQGIHAGLCPAFFPRGRIFYAPLMRSANDVHGIAGTTGGSPSIYVHPPVACPSTNIISSTAAAVAPGGFEPQWAYGSNHIIYGGTL